MKKFILAASVALFTFQCAPDGGNKNILKRGPEVERYDDVVLGNSEHSSEKTAAHGEHAGLKTSLEWMAFKTAAKTPVKGSFSTIDVIKERTNGTFLESLEGASVHISGMSVSSGDPVRDENLKKSFFGKFDDKIIIKFGKFENNKVASTIEINGKKVSKTITYTATENEVKLNTTLDIVKDLGLNDAFASISEACKAYHENKTWSEVGISASISK